MNISVIVPTTIDRSEIFNTFLEGWKDQFTKYNVNIIKVIDGDDVKLIDNSQNRIVHLKDYPELEEIIFNKNDGVRNFGFYYAYVTYNSDYYITLDDDVLPEGDTIGNHISILNKKVPTTKWINTLQDIYPRGFPYNIREESPVMVSHGVWNTNLDLDAPTQLLYGVDFKSNFNKLAIPSGCYIPMCGMNLAWSKDVMKYMYFAPMGYKVGIDRFADIWLGVVLKDKLDLDKFAMVTGYSEVKHTRASNVWANLKKEAQGLEYNEFFYKNNELNEYFKMYKEKRTRWEDLINETTN